MLSAVFSSAVFALLVCIPLIDLLSLCAVMSKIVASTVAMQQLGVPTSVLSRKIPEIRDCGDSTVDFLRGQSRCALIETVDMLSHHTHVRQAVRDYTFGLLNSAAKQQEALHRDNFTAFPCTIQKLDEDFQATAIVAHTDLDPACLSQLKSYDAKFVTKFFAVMMNCTPALKLPAACISKPVVTRLIARRIALLGHKPFDKLEKKDAVAGSKINWGKVGLFRLHVNGGKVTAVASVFNPEIKTDCTAEDITADFTIERGWALKQATLEKGSRKHPIFELFSREQRKFLAQWSGADKEVNDLVKSIVTDRDLRCQW